MNLKQKFEFINGMVRFLLFEKTGKRLRLLSNLPYILILKLSKVQ